MKYAVIFYFTEWEVSPDFECEPESFTKFVKNPSIRYYDSGFQALEAYANTKCQHSELVEGVDEEELKRNIESSLANHNDPVWCKEYFDSL